MKTTGDSVRHSEIEPAPTPMSLVKRHGGLVAVPFRKLPSLTDEIVRETLEQTRR